MITLLALALSGLPEQYCSVEVSAKIEMLKICAIQYGSPQPHVAVDT